MSGKPYRLAQGGRVIDRSRKISFTFDGRTMQGYEGDTLATAVLANGQRLMGRSFKYHRPRGVVGIGAEEMNALVGVGEGSRHEPNLRATQVELHDGLVAVSQNRWPSLAFDIGAINNRFSRLIPGGFYYKTFMWPQAFWKHVYEPMIRRAAGLGKAPEGRDPDTYEHVHAHCDVLVIGAGIAGLAAAEAAAAASGARVIIADESPRFGGIADIAGGTIENAPLIDWVRAKSAALASAENVHVLTRTTAVGHWHHNYLMLFERVADHDPALLAKRVPRHRLWKVRAKQVILATGAIERPIAFANNDRPGIMLATAARALIERYGVAPGMTGAVFTNNDDAYLTALAMKRVGMAVAAIIDARPEAGAIAEEARRAGLTILAGHAIAAVETDFGGQAITGIKVATYRKGQGRVVNEQRLSCDMIAMSGGFNPALHLWCHNGGKIAFDEALQSFRPSTHHDAIKAVGGANGTMDLSGTLAEAYDAGEKAASANAKLTAVKLPLPATSESERAPLAPIWFSPASGKYNEGNKHF
ncbi:MAG: 2Fe-2S iron-sulfur cluster-binding protein, partial [Parvibaculaceae bacterium]